MTEPSSDGSTAAASDIGDPEPGPPPRPTRWRDAAVVTLFIVTLPWLFNWVIIQRYHWKWPALLAGNLVLAATGVWLGTRLEARRHRGDLTDQAGTDSGDPGPAGEHRPGAGSPGEEPGAGG